MDATRYGNTLTQYPPDKVLRELNKAYCAFYSKQQDAVAIATGNWGCGAFHGNHRLKGGERNLTAFNIVYSCGIHSPSKGIWARFDRFSVKGCSKHEVKVRFRLNGSNTQLTTMRSEWNFVQNLSFHLTQYPT